MPARRRTGTSALPYVYPISFKPAERPGTNPDSTCLHPLPERTYDPVFRMNLGDSKEWKIRRGFFPRNGKVNR